MGAGIAGLAVAGALRARGFDVSIIERDAALVPLGAGILLGANAVAVLRALGVDLGASARPVPSVRITDARGRLVQETRLSSGGRDLATYVIHRTELHEHLAAHAGTPPPRCGVTVSGLVDGDAGVEARFSDGGTGTYDLVVGADGIHSSLRALRMGTDAPGVVYSGYTCWRLVCPDPGVDGLQEMWGRGRRVGFAPLGGGRLYAFLVANAPRGAPAPSSADAFRELFADFAAPVPAILDAASSGPAPLHHDLEELARPVWGGGRTWLVGDAAHAMLPNLGQGAAMALEDALALAHVLGAPGASRLDEAFARFLSLRRARIARLGRRSRQLGAMAQWSHPAACRLRDGLARLIPESLARRSLAAIVDPGVALAHALAPAPP